MNGSTNKLWLKWGLRLLAAAVISSLAVTDLTADETAGISVYDETGYTEYVENMMDKLDKLYIDFSEARGVDAPAAAIAEKEFLVAVHELMTYMNKKFDGLDPKQGAALSATETLVSIHAHTMLIDILAANQLTHLASHPYIE
jgi:hypothetical protein